MLSRRPEKGDELVELLSKDDRQNRLKTLREKSHQLEITSGESSKKIAGLFVPHVPADIHLNDLMHVIKTHNPELVDSCPIRLVTTHRQCCRRGIGSSAKDISWTKGTGDRNVSTLCSTIYTCLAAANVVATATQGNDANAPYRLAVSALRTPTHKPDRIHPLDGLKMILVISM